MTGRAAISGIGAGPDRTLGLVVTAVLAGVMALPVLVSGFVAVDWTDAAERAVVGIAEALVVAVWWARGHGLPRARGRWVPVGIVAWLAASVVSTAAAAVPAAAVVRTAEWVLHVAFGTVLWAEMQRSPEVRRAWLYAAAGGFAFVLAAAFVGKLADLSGTGRDWNYGFPLVLRLRLIGIYGLVALCVGAASSLGGNRRRVGRLDLALLMLGWTGVWWSGSRSALGAALVATVLLAVAARGRRLQWGLAMGIAAALGALAAEVVSVGTEGGIGYLLLRADPTGNAEDFTSGRTDLWRTTLEAVGPHPWLGLGPDGLFGVLLPLRLSHPHNAILQAVGEWGLVGAVPFVAVLGAMVFCGAASVLGPTDDLQVDRRLAGVWLVALAATAMLDGVTYEPGFCLLGSFAAAVVYLPRGGGWAGRATRESRWRRGIGVAALAGALVMGLHLGALRAVYGPGTPSPTSARVAFVRAFPSPPVLREVVWWGKAWARSHPEAALDLADWGRRRSRTPWEFDRLEADVRLMLGDESGAWAAADRAERALDHSRRYWGLPNREVDAEGANRTPGG